MESELNPADARLYRGVDETLHYLWDPCGVSLNACARNEYYSYLPKVFELVRDGRDADTIAAHLSTIVSEHMGMTGNIGAELKIAKILLDWAATIKRDAAPS